MIAIVEPGNTNTDDNTAENAHLQGHDATSAGNCAFEDIWCNRAVWQDFACKLQYSVAGYVHYKESNHGRKCSNFFLCFCHTDGNADSEDDWQVAKDCAACAAHNGEECMKNRAITEQAFQTVHFNCGSVGK